MNSEELRARALGEDAGPDNQEACQPNLVVAPRLPDGMPASSPSALAEGTISGEPASSKTPRVPSASASVVPLPQSEHQPPLGGRARLSPELAARAWVQVANAYRSAHGLGPL